jgi:hypothetical protein
LILFANGYFGHLVETYTRGQNFESLILTKNGLGYILGTYFTKESGHAGWKLKILQLKSKFAMTAKCKSQSSKAVGL